LNYLLDTNTCVGLLRGQIQLVEAVQKKPPTDFALSVITFYELSFGVRCSSRPEQEEEKVNRLCSTLHVLPLEKKVGPIAAHFRFLLEKEGTPIGPYDLLIAAHAFQSGLILITHNTNEFSRIPNLEIEDWEL
jgi:tRNA(fMet)-specific endonuclease VapC